MDQMVETMNHILFECESNQGALVWKTAREICERILEPNHPPDIAQEAINQLLAVLHNRRNQDRRYKAPRESRPTDWHQNENSLPRNWLTASEV